MSDKKVILQNMKETLLKMKEILSSEEKWTKGESFRDLDGTPIDELIDEELLANPSYRERIASVCLVGAKMLAIHNLYCTTNARYGYKINNYLTDSMADFLPRNFHYRLDMFNDDPNTTLQDIHMFLDKCIAEIDKAIMTLSEVG